MRSRIILALACTTMSTAAFAQAPAVAPRPKVVIATPMAGGAGTGATVASASTLFAVSPDGANETRVELDLENTPIREALKQLFGRAKQDHKVDDDVPDSARITVRAKNVRLSTALELLLQDAGLGVVRQLENGKVIYRIRKSGSDLLSAVDVLRSMVDNQFGKKLLAPRLATSPHLQKPGFKDNNLIDPKQLELYLRTFPTPQMGAAGGNAIPYILNMREQRSMFQCPHCKGQATVIRKDEQPKCEKCTRPFQSGWQFCPADGAKRPAARSEWKFCPFCSKKVEGEKGAGIPILEDIPFIGSLFRNAPTSPAAAPPALRAPEEVPGLEGPGEIRALPGATAVAPAKGGR